FEVTPGALPDVLAAGPGGALDDADALGVAVDVQAVGEGAGLVVGQLRGDAGLAPGVQRAEPRPRRRVRQPLLDLAQPVHHCTSVHSTRNSRSPSRSAAARASASVSWISFVPRSSTSVAHSTR